MAAGNQKKKKKHASGFWVKLLTMAAVILAVVFCIGIFFRVGSVTVTGSARYSTEEVIAASGIEAGENLLLISKSETSGKILARLPYIIRVQVHRQLPNQVNLEVTECTAAAVVEDDYGEHWLISKEGRVLEQISSEQAADYPLVTGFSAAAQQIGGMLVTEPASAAETVSAVLAALESSSAASHIVSIDVSKSYSIRMIYDALYEIDLGGTDELEYKFSYLEQMLQILAERDPEAGGRIDLSLETEKVGRFHPW